MMDAVLYKARLDLRGEAAPLELKQSAGTIVRVFCDPSIEPTEPLFSLRPIVPFRVAEGQKETPQKHGGSCLAVDAILLAMESMALVVSVNRPDFFA